MDDDLDNIIEFDTTEEVEDGPITMDRSRVIHMMREIDGLKRIISAKNREILDLKSQMAITVSVSEFLRIQLADLITQIQILQISLGNIMLNLRSLQNRLPNMTPKLESK